MGARYGGQKEQISGAQAMRKLLTTLTALTLVGGVLLGAPVRTLAVGESAVYWISNASVGAGTSCASPTHEYISGDLTARLNDLLDDILDEVAEEDYASVTIAICEADDGAQQVYEMDDDTDPEVDVTGAEITIAGVQWDATSEADVADAGDVVIDGNEDYSPFEFNNADVYIGYLTIRDAFDDNAGAAIHFEQDSPGFIFELNLDHVVIDGAWIDNGNGAGVYAEGSVTIADSTFTDNSADNGSGGAVYVGDAVSVTISDSVFGNPNDDSGCGADYTVTVTNSSFLNNDADDQGGAISDGQNDTVSPLTEVIVTGSYFYQNEADLGAAINLDGTTLTLSDSTFIENHAVDDGGALELCNNEAVTVTGSRFVGNSSESSGGAIQVNCDTANLTIESNQFQRNTTVGQGGAIRVQTGVSGTSITRNTFIGNSAEQGGAVSINDGDVDSYLWSITRNTFTKNRATLNGGALHMALDNSGNVVTPNVKKNRFRGNSAPAAGAVVVESDYGTERVILRRYERGLRGNSFQSNRATSERRSATIGVHFDD